MHTYLRNKPAWMQLMIFGGLAVGLLLISSLLGTSIVARFNHISVTQLSTMNPSDYGRPEMAGIVKGLLIIQFFGLFLMPSLIFAYLADPHPFAYAGLKAPQKNSFLLLGVIIMIAAYFTVEFLGILNEAIVHFLPKGTQTWIERGESDANGMLQSVLSIKTPADLLMTIILVGALPAIGEELFFRGILQKLFIQIFKSPWPGIVFTGFLFSAFHMQFMGLLPRMALGIILGSLYWYSGSLYTSMLGHFIYNTINVLLIYFKFEDLDSKPGSVALFTLIGLISLALVVFLLNFLRKKSSTRYQTEFPASYEDLFSDDAGHPL